MKMYDDSGKLVPYTGKLDEEREKRNASKKVVFRRVEQAPGKQFVQAYEDHPIPQVQ